MCKIPPPRFLGKFDFLPILACNALITRVVGRLLAFWGHKIVCYFFVYKILIIIFVVAVSIHLCGWDIALYDQNSPPWGVTNCISPYLVVCNVPLLYSFVKVCGGAEAESKGLEKSPNGAKIDQNSTLERENFDFPRGSHPHTRGSALGRRGH